MILAVAAAKKLVIKQLKIKTSFLHGDLEEEIYMNQPIGYDDGSTQVCKLQRSLYGLKQAPRCWNKKFKNMLHSFDLQETNADSFAFISKKNNHLLIVAIFVYDKLIAATTSEQVNDMVRCLKDNFETKEGDLDQFLCIEVNRKMDGSIFIHQTSYCERIISKFNMEGTNVVLWTQLC